MATINHIQLKNWLFRNTDEIKINSGGKISTVFRLGRTVETSVLNSTTSLRSYHVLISYQIPKSTMHCWLHCWFILLVKSTFSSVRRAGICPVKNRQNSLELWSQLPIANDSNELMNKNYSELPISNTKFNTSEHRAVCQLLDSKLVLNNTIYSIIYIRC